MASRRTLRASSSSSSIPRCTFDAFLSFRGEDTRNGFTDHLHDALKRKGIRVFRDDEKLERGKYVGDGLLKAIQESRYAIVVISTNYASSKWCLIELVEILECMRGPDMRVLPVFYRVDPSDVRHQTGTFAEAFARHEKDPEVDDDKMQKWRAALNEVGKISGWHVDDGRPESKVVKEISRKIFCGLSHNFSNVSKDLVGIESSVEEMESILGMGLDDVRFLGIWGMGGIGKTTLAEVIYKRIAYKFEARCFISNVREETKKHGLLHLQKQVISQIFGESETNIQINPCVATNMIASTLRQRRVLIILDDMDEDGQVDKLAGSHDCFGQGSRIIITSRDLHFLEKVPVDKTYKVEELNKTEALELFSRKAFKKPHPEEKYVELSKDIVSYAQGLPLALKVFGSLLFGREMDAWESARDLLKENPDAEILDKLRISYDGLTNMQKDLFLDIACFYNGAYMDTIKHKLESFGYYPNFNTKVLVEKSLITISEFGRLEMHDLLQKMGQEIVRCESTKELGERSRLWCNKDVIRVLKKSTGTNAVSGIVLELPLQKQEQLNIEAFSKMKKLKMLQISINDNDFLRWLSNACVNLCTNLEWHGDLSNFMLSNELCIMEWLGYPFGSLPTNFQSDNLVELIMRNSCIKQLWVGRNSFDKLKHIDLSGSENLMETPDLSGVPNLEKLKLAHCTSLSEVHPSIGFPRRLKHLDLQGCKHLKRLPDEMTSLKSLCYLRLSGCSRLNKIPDRVDNMPSLQCLYLDGTAIKKIPLSFKRLLSLVFLNISNCSRLKKGPKNLLRGMECLLWLYVGGSATRKLPIGCGANPIINLLLPNSFSSLSSSRKLDLSYRNHGDPSSFMLSIELRILDLELTQIDLSHSKYLIETPDFSVTPNLEELNLVSCTSLSKVHPSIGFLRKLKGLDLCDCIRLEGLPDEINLECLEYLNLSGCSRLNTLPNSVGNMTSLQYLYLNGTAIKELPLSFASLSSLVCLSISGCSRLEKIPNDLSGMECLECLYAYGTAIRELPSSIVFLKKLKVLDFGGEHGSDSVSLLIPNSFSGLSSLQILDLSYCNLLDGAIPNDLGCLFSLCSLNLSGNKFTRIPDSVAQLSRLYELILDDCSCLHALPKLPLGLASLSVRNCPSLECLYKEMEIMWRSSNEKLRSIDCSVVQYYIDDDGKPFKILRPHPRSPLWSEESGFDWHSLVECGPPLVGSGIPEWFNDKSIDLGLGPYWKGYAVFIVYEFHDEPHTTHPRKSRKRKVDERKGNSNSTSDGTNSNFPIFVCHFQEDGVDAEKPLVLRAPGVPSVGPNGFWVFIPSGWFNKIIIGSLKASVTTSSLNVEVKECGARVVRDVNDASEFYQLLKTISPRGLDLPTSYDNICNRRPYLNVQGPIIINKSKVVASGSIGSVNCQHPFSSFFSLY